MTHNQLGSKIGRFAMSLTIWLAIAALPCAMALSGEKETMEPKAFFDFVAILENTRPFTREGIEALLNAQLGTESENDSWIYYVSNKIGPNRFGIEISEIDLRVKMNDPSHKSLLSIEFTGLPIGPEDIRRHYPNSSIVLPMAGPPPQGISPNAFISYWVTKDWGKISFGFRVRNPDRLAGLTFHGGPTK